MNKPDRIEDVETHNLHFEMAERAWYRICGFKLARRTRFDSYHAGTVNIVVTSSAWRAELEHLETWMWHQLTDRERAFITRFNFVVGPL